jgi:hypothetical protein
MRNASRTGLGHKAQTIHHLPHLQTVVDHPRVTAGRSDKQPRVYVYVVKLHRHRSGKRPRRTRGCRDDDYVPDPFCAGRQRTDAPATVNSVAAVPDHARIGRLGFMAELLIAVNPDEDSRLPYLLRIPQPGGDLLFRTAGTWPRVKALYCYPVDLAEWPADAVIVERLALRSCQRRGAAIDVIVARLRENRSQLVFTTARGRDAVFWQSPRTRKQARPNVRTPTARAHGIEELQILVDAHEQYPYRFATQQVRTVRRALPCGDYGLVVDGLLVASVERKSLADLVGSLTGGKLRYQIADLAALPRAALVVEDRYSQLFKLDRVRPAAVADGLAELQIRWPNVPVVFGETRQLAEEWTYRFLAAAHVWAATEHAALQRISPPIIDVTELDQATAAPEPSTAEVRVWARAAGLPVPDRGRLHPDIWQAWHDANHPR